MSESSISSVDCSHNSSQEKPKRFLKKGEGLKRFAEYKPPQLKSTVKLHPLNQEQQFPGSRRQTFVKPKFNNNSSKSSFFDPFKFADDPANLPREIPKVAPPKIMHTPIRPNKTPLAPYNSITKDDQNYNVTPKRSITYSKETNSNSDDSAKKVEESGFRVPLPKQQECNRPKQQKAVQKPSAPSPTSVALAISKRLDRLESTINELTSKVAACKCFQNDVPEIQPSIEEEAKPKIVTRSRAKATKSTAQRYNR